MSHICGLGPRAGFPIVSLLAHTAELPAGRREAIAALMAEHGLSWAGADGKVDELTELSPCGPYFRKRGDRSRDGGWMYSAEMVGWQAKCAFVLMSGSTHDVPSAEAIMASLPTVAEVIGMNMTSGDACSWCCAMFGPFYNVKKRPPTRFPKLLRHHHKRRARLSVACGFRLWEERSQ